MVWTRIFFFLRSSISCGLSFGHRDRMENEKFSIKSTEGKITWIKTYSIGSRTFKNWGHIHPLLLTPGQPGYK
jgi:hypothetical protein